MSLSPAQTLKLAITLAVVGATVLVMGIFGVIGPDMGFRDFTQPTRLEAGTQHSVYAGTDLTNCRVHAEEAEIPVLTRSGRTHMFTRDGEQISYVADLTAPATDHYWMDCGGASVLLGRAVTDADSGRLTAGVLTIIGGAFMLFAALFTGIFGFLARSAAAPNETPSRSRRGRNWILPVVMGSLGFLAVAGAGITHLLSGDVGTAAILAAASIVPATVVWAHLRARQTRD